MLLEFLTHTNTIICNLNNINDLLVALVNLSKLQSYGTLFVSKFYGIAEQIYNNLF